VEKVCAGPTFLHAICHNIPDNVDVAIQRGVPTSTVRSWLTTTRSDVITVDVLDVSRAELQRHSDRLANLHPLHPLHPLHRLHQLTNRFKFPAVRHQTTPTFEP